MSMIISNIPAINELSSSVNGMESLESGVISLEDRLLRSFSSTAVDTAGEKNSILNKVEQPHAVTSPEKLFDLQVRTSNYNLEVSLLSTLTRKCVGAVETLLRS
ncbi:type III secretion system inner rod subunit SctI [Providencia alcalifaciens]|nr:type III secretion system inner rod subunit SctI [Providencia alcalifaciens]